MKIIRNTYNPSSCKRALGDGSVQLLIDDKQQTVASHEIWMPTFRRCLLMACFELGESSYFTSK